MKIDRRRALALLGLGAGAAAGPAAAAPLKVAFEHGVASGDPTQDRAIIWTRITPKAAAAPAAVPYSWSVAPVDRRPGGARGSGVTGPDMDFTAKVDVGRLDPGRAYTYSFKAGGVDSPVGHFRTLPAGPVKDVVMAVCTCSLYPGGYFNAYEAIANLDRVDVVVHLGDYIYEYGPEGYGADTGKRPNRFPTPAHECITLDDYRGRYACHRSDAQLQAAHARAPWIVSWDDHESANDSWEGGAQNHNPEKGEGSWAARKAAAVKAFYEWMPIREPLDSPLANYRSFHFGDLAALMMTETRLTARSHQLDYGRDLPVVDGKPDLTSFRAKWNDPSRRMMSPVQEAWMANALAASVKAGHAWQVIGNQVVMARTTTPDFVKMVGQAKFDEVLATLPAEARRPVAKLALVGALGLPYGLDSWDGYPVARERLYGSFTAAGANPIVLSGDSHAFWANELHDQSAGALVAVEFGATGITSPGGGDAVKEEDIPLNRGFTEANREVIFCDQAAKGFVLLTLSRDHATGALMAVSTIFDKTYETKALKTYRVKPKAGGGVLPLEEV